MSDPRDIVISCPECDWSGRAGDATDGQFFDDPSSVEKLCPDCGHVITTAPRPDVAWRPED